MPSRACCVMEQSHAIGHAHDVHNRVQVTVLGRGRLGGDVFLGEVVIPLREVEDFQASETRRYTLGRRSAKEKVLPWCHISASCQGARQLGHTTAVLLGVQANCALVCFSLCVFLEPSHRTCSVRCRKL